MYEHMYVYTHIRLWLFVVMLFYILLKGQNNSGGGHFECIRRCSSSGRCQIWRMPSSSFRSQALGGLVARGSH